MRILLVNPPNSGRSIPEERYGIDSIKQIFRGEPLALEALAGNLTDHDVRILDLKVEPENFVSELESFNPEIIGFTAMTCEANAVLQLAEQAKSYSPAPVVVGGCHASSDPSYFNRQEIDWIVVGLGIQSFRELVDALESRQDSPVPGIARTQPGQKLRWQTRRYNCGDLGQDCAPRYDLVERYRSEYSLQSLGLKMGLVASAAGCPYDCHFCCIAPITDGRYITADVDSVVRDVRSLEQTPVIRLVDANSFGNPSHALRLAEALAAAGVQKQFLADVRSDTVVRNPDLLKRWKDVGLRCVVIGFEEIDDQALGGMNKENSAATNLEAIRVLHEIGLTIIGDFIISPEYTEQQFATLGQFVREQQIDLPMYTVLTPLPGTRLHQQMADKISIHNLDYYTLTNAVIPTRLDEEVFYQRYAELLAEGHRSAKV